MSVVRKDKFVFTFQRTDSCRCTRISSPIQQALQDELFALYQTNIKTMPYREIDDVTRGKYTMVLLSAFLRI